MSDTSWKAFERRIAKRLGTTRIAVTGERNGADALTPMFAYQFKKRSKSTPPAKSLLAWLDGICEAADRAGNGRVGVVVWQRSQGCLDGEALVVLKLSDWEALHGSRPVPLDEAVHADEDTAPASTSAQLPGFTMARPAGPGAK